MVLRLNLEKILKVYFRSVISSLIMMRSRENFWKACKKIQIRIETLFVLYIQDTECLVRCPFCHLFIGLLQKKSKQEWGGWGLVARGRGVEDILFWSPPGIFHFFTLPLEIPDKTKLSPWTLHRIVLDPLKIPRPKTQTDRWNFHITFFWSPYGNSILFLINPWKFHMLFLW